MTDPSESYGRALTLADRLAEALARDLDTEALARDLQAAVAALRDGRTQVPRELIEQLAARVRAAEQEAARQRDRVKEQLDDAIRGHQMRRAYQTTGWGSAS